MSDQELQNGLQNEAHVASQGQRRATGRSPAAAIGWGATAPPLPRRTLQASDVAAVTGLCGVEPRRRSLRSVISEGYDFCM